MAYKVVFKSDEFIKKLKHIALDLPTGYYNQYPYNLGYYWEPGGYWTFDCWNLPKSLIWGWQETKTAGYFQPANPSTGLGDWDGWTILQCCTNKSSDFSKVTPGAFLLTGDASHAGIYVGDFTVEGNTYNVIECTPIWGGGVQPSYVDASGYRRRHKGDIYNWSSWKYHGLLPWVDYSSKPEPAPTPSDKIEVGDKVEVINAVTYNGQPFWCYYDTYTVMELNGDRAVIGVDGVITAAVNVKDIRKVKTPEQTSSKIAVGDTVKVKKAVTYTGAPFYCYYPSYTVMELIGDRAVIGVNGVITAAVNVKNLQKL